jgi:HK97 family phage prohead protease
VRLFAFMDRAFSTLELKALDEGKRTFKGIATTMATDRMGDVVESSGAQFKLPLPLLWQHDSSDPIGWVKSAKVTKNGIEIEGEVASVDDGPLKERLNKAWQYIKSGIVRGLSIGFNPLESSEIEGSRWGRKFTKWEWLELSAVTIPANQEATILAVKSFATKAASGLGDPSPGVSGNPTKPRKVTEMTLQELRTAHAEKTARLRELQEATTAEKRGYTPEEGSEVETLLSEVEELDGQIRTKRVEALVAGSATPVNKSNTFGRAPTVIVKREDPADKFEGQSFVRLLLAKSLARVLDESPISIAQKRWGQTHPRLVEHIKASVAGGGTGSGEWAAELAQSDARFNGDFITFLYSKTIFDRLPLRSIPARVHVKGQDGAATGYWVGESKPIPASAQDYSSVELTPLKVAALAVCSNELLMDSDPAAEMLVRDALVEASSQRVDTTFLGAAAASAGVSPAGILNQVASLGNAGSDADAVRADIMSLYAPFITAKNASNLAFIMTPSMAKSISLMRNAFGQREFEGLNAMGGTLEGDPVYTGDNVGAGDLILLKPSDIWKIGDTGVQVTMSNVATIEQADDPTGATDTPVAQTNYPVSMFQSESTAFKVVRRINYAKRRSGVVQYIGDAYYGSQASS